MNQEPGLALAGGTSAQNIHELDCHLLMALLSLYSLIILWHITCSKVILQCHPHIPAWAGNPPAQNWIPGPSQNNQTVISM